jgi:hypothetical protein
MTEDFDLNEGIDASLCLSAFEKEYGVLPWWKINHFAWCFLGGKQYHEKLIAFRKGWLAHGTMLNKFMRKERGK